MSTYYQIGLLWNPVVNPEQVNSTVTLLFLPTVSPALVLTTTQNLESVCTQILFRMTALSFLTESTTTTNSTWSLSVRSVCLKMPEVPGGGSREGEEDEGERE